MREVTWLFFRLLFILLKITYHVMKSSTLVKLTMLIYEMISKLIIFISHSNKQFKQKVLTHTIHD